MKSLKRLALVAPVAALSVPAFAAGIDVAAVVTNISDQLTPVGLIGAAVLLLLVGIKAYKWVRRTF